MNWGYKLTVTFIIFAGMIGYLVYRSMNTHFDLVEKDYYESELKYQEVIDGFKNTSKLSKAPDLLQSGKNIILQMPDEMKNTLVTGTIQIYCSYNAAQDKTIPIQPDSNGLQVISPSLQTGIYTAKLSWTSTNINYYTEQKIVIQ
ncbi:MAG: FixH family protein [Sediminibacterium sp.]